MSRTIHHQGTNPYRFGSCPSLYYYPMQAYSYQRTRKEEWTRVMITLDLEPLLGRYSLLKENLSKMKKNRIISN